ncbi:med21 domain-containing protein [Aspergillus lucknowensis]|uniref:Mediator of RNA polymerase II transcription subunit 21 n=1 Tax=Aspergillus lucknowensis TaxID=176173 RepID=A0ABR4M8F0_9EURO
MADILTQLQTCLDQLATQFYATIGYLTTYHDNSPATPPDNPTAAPALAKIQKNSTNPPIPASAAAILSTTSQASPPAGGGGTGGAATTPGPGPGTAPGTGTGEGGGVDPSLPPRPDSPRTFAARQRELARDLVIKEQQIEYLISVLPGIASSEAEQERRIRELGVELRGAEEVRDRKVKELRALRRRLEGVLGAVEKGIYGER